VGRDADRGILFSQNFSRGPSVKLEQPTADRVGTYSKRTHPGSIDLPKEEEIYNSTREFPQFSAEADRGLASKQTRAKCPAQSEKDTIRCRVGGGGAQERISLSRSRRGHSKQGTDGVSELGRTKSKRGNGPFFLKGTRKSFMKLSIIRRFQKCHRSAEIRAQEKNAPGFRRESVCSPQFDVNTITFARDWPRPEQERFQAAHCWRSSRYRELADLRGFLGRLIGREFTLAFNPRGLLLLSEGDQKCAPTS